MQAIRARLETELKELERELRQELPREIQRAREMGDLRENAEYKAALERQSFVRSRMGQIHQRLAELSRIGLETIPTGTVHLGSRVRVIDLDCDEEVQYEIVVAEEADPARGRITLASPIGQGLMGRSVGDEVKVKTPSGVRLFEVIFLRTIHEVDGEEAAEGESGTEDDEEG
jgi:transcription elongation factor GreA